MYWSFICLAVSMLALPFALTDPTTSGLAGFSVVAVFAVLAAAFFLFGREAPPPRPRAGRDARKEG